MSCGIYCIENIINGKKYIGWSINTDKRYKKHLYDLKNNKHKNIFLQRAFNLYGENSFNIFIIEELENNEEILKLMEIYFIAYYNSYSPNGYNLTRGGDGTYGYVFTDEHKEKISKSNKGKKRSEEIKQKMKERLNSEETRLKLSERMKGTNNPNWGKKGKFSKEHRKRLSESQKLRIDVKWNKI